MSKWQYRCPEGHSNWTRYGETHYCLSCDQRFNKLIDWKTKKPITLDV